MSKTEEFDFLVIDDDFELLELIVETLEAEGYKCIGVTDPSTALLHIKSKNFSVVLTDINMPGLTGFQFADEVTSIDPSVNLKFMSGGGKIHLEGRDVDIYEFCSNSKKLALIIKPFDSDQLVDFLLSESKAS